MDEIILVGSGGHARACIDVIELSGQFKIVGIVGKNETDNQGSLGYPIIGTDDNLQNLRKKYNYAFIAVGQIKSTETRIKLYQLLKKMDYTLPVIISPRAYVSKHAEIGEGTMIMHNATVNANAKIGKNCIINNKTLIEHDAIIGNHCHVATGAIVNGEVAVGDESFIGSGVITKQSISIGNNCVIGAGVVLKNDIQSDQIIRV